ncbi:MAG: alpha/beta fold hydrolase [bacterium]
MNLFFRSYGTGPPFVILHGLFGISDNWVTLGKKFGETFHVLIPDLRNHGQSPHSPRFDFPSIEEDILELIEQEAHSPVFLMGHSLGGRVVVNLALHHPRLISKLVIVDISLRKYPPHAEHLELLKAMQDIKLNNVHSRTEVERQLQERVPSLKLRQFLLKNLYWREKGQLSWRLNLPAITENLPSIFEGGSVTGLYPGPALFLRGGKSDFLLDEDIPEIHKQFPGSTVVTVEGASHWVHADNPGEFFRIVKAFLDI